MQPYKVDTNFVATSGDPEEVEYSLFDQVNFLATTIPDDGPTTRLESIVLDDDYSYDMILPAKEGYSLSAREARQPKKRKAVSLEEVLKSPLGTYRGIFKPASNVEDSAWRMMMDFNWSRRPEPSSNNKEFAQRHARRLQSTLEKKGLAEDYYLVSEDYKTAQHIEPVPDSERSAHYYTTHFPVVKDGSARGTRLRPVFDWRGSNDLQSLPPTIDNSLLGPLMVTRLFEHVLWSDLRQAFLNFRCPTATRKAHAFIICNPKDGSFEYFRFRGMPMGARSSPGGMQAGSSIIVEVANENTENRLRREDGLQTLSSSTIIQDALFNSELDSAEVEGLEPQALLSPSRAAQDLLLALQKKTAEARSRSHAKEVKDTSHCGEARRRWAYLVYKKVARAKYMDDVITGCNGSQQQLLQLHEEDKTAAASVGQLVHPAKTKYDWEEKEVSGLGIVWGADDSVASKPANLTDIRKNFTDNGRLTVREVLSGAHLCHDILGLHSWRLLSVKLILRKAYIRNKKLDDFISKEESLETIQILEEYNALANHRRYPRYVNTLTSLNLYADACSHAIGWCVVGDSLVNPLYANSSLVPLNQCSWSIMRKEHLALERGLESLYQLVTGDFFPFSTTRRIGVFTDSLIVKQRVDKILRRLKDDTEGNKACKIPKSWSAWEFNHSLKAARLLLDIAEAMPQLAQGAPVVLFEHCPGALNIADPFSRGLDPSVVDIENAQAWLDSIHQGKARSSTDVVNLVVSGPNQAEEEHSLFHVTVDASLASATNSEVKEAASGLHSMIARAQQEDPYSGFLRGILSAEHKMPENFDTEPFGPAERAKLRAMYVLQHENTHNGEMLPVLRMDVGRDSGELGAIYVPDGVRQDVIAALHTLCCHRNSRHQVNAMEGKYYWKAMRRDVKHFFKQCPGCQRSRGLGAWVDTHPHINPRVHLAVNDALSIDWLGPVKDTVQGGELTTTTTAPQYCLHVSDPFSGANQFYVASDRTALTAVRLLEEHCWRFGWPYVISSDCDKAFQSKVFQSWCLANQLLHVTDPPYSAQRRAYLERVHAELWSCIRALRLATSDGVTNSSRSSLRPWYTLLPMISHCLNSSAGDEEGAVSPHTLVFAYQARGPPVLEPRPRPERLRPFIEGHQDQKPFKITSEAIIGFRREQEELLRSYRDHLVRKVREGIYQVC